MKLKSKMRTFILQDESQCNSILRIMYYSVWNYTKGETRVNLFYDLKMNLASINYEDKNLYYTFDFYQIMKLEFSVFELQLKQNHSTVIKSIEKLRKI